MELDGAKHHKFFVHFMKRLFIAPQKLHRFFSFFHRNCTLFSMVQNPQLAFFRSYGWDGGVGSNWYLQNGIKNNTSQRQAKIIIMYTVEDVR